MATLAMAAIGSEVGMVLSSCATWQKRMRDGVDGGAMTSSTSSGCAGDKCQQRGSTAMVASGPSRISSSSSSLSVRGRLMSGRLLRHSQRSVTKNTCLFLSPDRKDRQMASGVRRSTVAGQGTSSSTSTDPIKRPQISDSAEVLPAEEVAAAAAVIAPETPAEPAAADAEAKPAAADAEAKPAAAEAEAKPAAEEDAAKPAAAEAEAKSAAEEDAAKPAEAEAEAKPAAAEAEAKPATPAADAKPTAEDKPAAQAEAKPAAEAEAKPAKPAAAAAAAPKAKPKAKPPVKEFAVAMVEDVIPPLKDSLVKENITCLALSFQDNQLTGSFIKGSIPYTFNVYFPDGSFEGVRGFSVSSMGREPSTVEPFMIDERKIPPELVVFWVMKRLYAQKILP